MIDEQQIAEDAEKFYKRHLISSGAVEKDWEEETSPKPSKIKGKI